MKKISKLLLLSALILIASGAPRAVNAQSKFYEGKTIRLIVGFTAGGGYDAYTRTIGRHMGKHIPGNPAIIVENMPGAGSMISGQLYLQSSETRWPDRRSFHRRTVSAATPGQTRDRIRRRKIPIRRRAGPRQFCYRHRQIHRHC